MIEKSRVDDGIRLWLAAVKGAVVPVAVECDGVQQKDKGGELYWATPDDREVSERVRMATGIYVDTERLVWSEAIGRDVRKIKAYGRLVDGAVTWRSVTTASGDVVEVDGVGCRQDRSRGEHPFPSGTTAGCIPQILIRATRFGDIDVPVGAALWACHVPGKIAVQYPAPPDPSKLLVLQFLGAP